MASNAEPQRNMNSRLIINKIQPNHEVLSMEIFLPVFTNQQSNETPGTNYGDNKTQWKEGLLIPTPRNSEELLIEITNDINEAKLNVERIVKTTDLMITNVTEEPEIEDEYVTIDDNSKVKKNPKLKVNEICDNLMKILQSPNKSPNVTNFTPKNFIPDISMDDTFYNWSDSLRGIKKMNRKIDIYRNNLDMLLRCEEYHKLFKFTDKKNDNVQNRAKSNENKINFICEFCQQNIKSLEELLKHQKIHKKNEYNCVYCNLNFVKFKNALTHWYNECPWINKISMMTSQMLTCKKCKSSDVYVHIVPNFEKEEHFSKMILCNVCKHVSSDEKNEQTNQSMLCHVCGKIEQGTCTNHIETYDNEKKI